MEELLATLSALDVKLEIRDGKLHVSAPPGVLTPALQREVGTHKDALIEKLQASRRAQPDDDLPQIVPMPEDRYQPFPLNDVQHAYWIGRSTPIELGEVSTHVYFELECEALDPV